MKQRVVGAIVLVALAVIFLPMLLDGSGRPERVDVPVEIPAEPEAPESQFGDDTAGSAQAPPEDDGATTGAADEPAPDADAASAEPETGTPDAAAEPAAGGDGGADADEAGNAEDGPSAWVVQVGSFAQETNALVLRDRLREEGFEAFTEQGSSDGRALWRVRVGPVPTRERAEDLKARLEEQRGKAALVMSYP